MSGKVVLLAFVTMALVSAAAGSFTVLQKIVMSELDKQIQTVVENSIAEAAASPAMKFVVTQGGLTQFSSILLPIINTKFQQMSIPDVSMEQKVPVVGKATITLSKISITSFNLASLSTTLSAPQTLTLAFSGLNFHLNMNWKWRQNSWPHISSSGSADVTPVNGAATIGVAITAANGRPHTVVNTNSVSFQDFKISFHGSWLSWLYDLLVSLFKSSIKNAVSSAASAQIQKVIDVTLNNEFSKLPLVGHFGGGKSRSDIDFSVTNTQVATSGSTLFFAVSDAFSVTNNQKAAVCPLQPVALPGVVPTSHQNMIQLLLADSFLNCISWVSWSNGALVFQITDASLPKTFPVRLNTNNWVHIIPQLTARYPNQAMVLDVSAPSYPTVTSASTGLTGSSFFEVRCSVVNKDGSVTHTHTLGVTIGLGLNIFVVNAQPPATDSTFHLTVTSMVLKFNVVDSAIGPIDVSLVNSILSDVEPLVRGMIDAALAEGFPLPISPGFQFVQPQVSFFPGYFAIGADFTYKLSFMDALLDAAATDADDDAIPVELPIVGGAPVDADSDAIPVQTPIIDSEPERLPLPTID